MTWADLQKLGYDVGEASSGVNVVSGYGITNLYVKVDDQETLDQLCNPEAHAERVRQSDPSYVPERALTEATAVALAPLPQDATLADVIARLNAL